MAIYRGSGGAGDANNTVSVNEIEQYANSANLSKLYAEEWATKAEDSLISTGAGGDGSTDYSSLHWAAKSTIAKTASETAQAASEAAQALAETAQTAAETAQTNASASATSASTSATNASNSASAASTSETNASASATSAASSATAASTSETNAASSATSAATSETNAASSASSASASATSASTSATNAASSASSAATSATNASTSETNAASSASSASTSATNAASSATEAASYVADQTGNAGKFLQTNGTVVSWQAALISSDIGVNVQAYNANTLFRSSSTGSGILPSGTTAQRDGSPSAGYFRFNSSLGAFEGYNGTAWGAVGGGATGGGSDDVFYENAQIVTSDYTITSGKNAMSAGDITINTGVTVTVPTGSVWTIV